MDIQFKRIKNLSFFPALSLSNPAKFPTFVSPKLSGGKKHSINLFNCWKNISKM